MEASTKTKDGPIISAKKPVYLEGPKKAAKAKVKRTPNAAFMKAMTPSSALAAVIGNGAVPRTEVVKKSKMRARELDEIIDHLIQSQALHLEETSTGGRKRLQYVLD